MHRFFADPDKGTEDLEYLTGDEARHALTVLRLKEGCPVEVVSGGKCWSAVIHWIERSSVCLKKLSLLPATEPSLSVTLYQGLPKADKMDWIVQKATELGVIRIVPVAMERSVMKVSASDAPKKTERWCRIAMEAAKQSGRSRVPEITPFCRPAELKNLAGFPVLNVVPWEEAALFGPLSLRKSFPAPGSVGILIGPEGGITADEITLLKSDGFLPMTLGKRILRTETAGLAAVSALMCLYGEMDS